MYEKTFFDTFDYLASNWMLPLGGLFIALYVGWVMDPATRKADIQRGTSWTQNWFYKGWVILLKYIAPIAVMLIILQRVGLIDIDAIIG